MRAIPLGFFAFLFSGVFLFLFFWGVFWLPGGIWNSWNREQNHIWAILAPSAGSLTHCARDWTRVPKIPQSRCDTVGTPRATPLFLIPSPNNCRAQHSRVSVGRGISEIASHSHWCWTEDSRPSIKSRVRVIMWQKQSPLWEMVRGVFQEVETVCIHRFHLPLPR